MCCDFSAIRPRFACDSPAIRKHFSRFSLAFCDSSRMSQKANENQKINPVIARLSGVFSPPNVSHHG